MAKTINHADLLAKPGSDIRLADFDPAFTSDFKSKTDAKSKLRTEHVPKTIGASHVWHDRYQDIAVVERRK